MLFKLLISLFGLASSLSTEQLNEEKLRQLELKLRFNQNITDMSEDQYQMLWNKTMESLETSSISKEGFRYQDSEYSLFDTYYTYAINLANKKSLIFLLSLIKILGQQCCSIAVLKIGQLLEK